MKEKYKILYVGDLPKINNSGGAFTLNFEFLKRLSKDESFEVINIFPFFKDDKLLEYNFKTIPIPTKYFRAKTWGDVLSKYDFYFKFKKFIKKFPIEDFDLIHIDTTTHPALLIKNKPVVLFLHGSPKYKRGIKHLIRHPYATLCEILEEKHFRDIIKKENLKYIFTNSEHSKNLIIKDFNLSDDVSNKIIKIQLGVNIERFELEKLDKANCQREILKKINFNLDLQMRFLLFVGGFAAFKNQDELIISLKEIIKIYPKTILLLAGKPLDIYNKCKNLITKLKLEKNVIIFPDLQGKELGKLFKAADIYVSASIETFGISIAEALKTGLPVVCWDKGAIKELFTNNEEGFLVNSRKDFIEKVLLLIQNSDLRQKMSLKAKQMGTKYSWDNFYNEIIKYYLKILENK
jgi:glycosyltransferase involved in cell wall biosynthesis